MEGEKDDVKLPILYMQPGSFFSQIAMLGLHEKRAKYSARFVNLFEIKNFEPWFLKLNPAGQVPVLQVGDTIVSGSNFILLYLDEKFAGDTSTRFLPPKFLKEVEEWDGLLRKLPNAFLTFGVLYHPECSSGIKIPEYEQVKRKELIERSKEYLDRVQQLHENPPEVLTVRRNFLDKFNQMMSSKEELEKGIANAAGILDLVEKQLSSHTAPAQKDWWLCCEEFTSADVLLAVFLLKLDHTGLSTTLLDPTTRPNLVRYKERVEGRPTFQAFLHDVWELHSQHERWLEK